MRANSDELQRLRGLKRRAEDLAASHLEALEVFYLTGGEQPLTGLAGGGGTVGGFPQRGHPGHAAPGQGRSDQPTRRPVCGRSRCVASPTGENIRLASRNEMITLCDDLGRRPERAEQILSHLRAELADDDTFQEIDAAAKIR